MNEQTVKREVWIVIGHNPELKGDVHPIQCPVNALGEVNEEYTYGKASRTADVTDGKIKKNHLRHLPLGLSVYKLLLKVIWSVQWIIFINQ